MNARRPTRPFLSIPDEPRDSRSVIAWWEGRRFAYSLVVLSLAILSEAGKALLYGGYAQRTHAQPEWNLVILFIPIHLVIALVLSNVCYTGGWISELLVRAVFKGRVPRYGPVAYVTGVALSVAAVLALFVVYLIHMMSA